MRCAACRPRASTRNSPCQLRTYIVCCARHVSLASPPPGSHPRALRGAPAPPYGVLSPRLAPLGELRARQRRILREIALHAVRNGFGEFLLVPVAFEFQLFVWIGNEC